MRQPDRRVDHQGDLPAAAVHETFGAWDCAPIRSNASARLPHRKREPDATAVRLSQRGAGMVGEGLRVEGEVSGGASTPATVW